jgi:hypothetical protein
MNEYTLSKGTQASVDQAVATASDRLAERARWFLQGASKFHADQELVWEANGAIAQGYEHPVRLLTCDMKQKHKRGQMWWQIEGEPGEYLCLMYVPNESSPVCYVVAFGPYETFTKKAVDGIVTVSRSVRASKWFELNFMTGSEEPW